MGDIYNIMLTEKPIITWGVLIHQSQGVQYSLSVFFFMCTEKELEDVCEL